jgi:hypothetical protein
MQKLIRHLIRFTLFLIVLAFAIQLCFSILIRGKSLNEVDNLEQTTNTNATLVFLGSSRCWVQFDPSFFDKTFHLKSVNIGVDGHSELAMATLRLKNYLSRNKPPKFIILSFDPLMNGDSETTNENFIHKDFFARYSFFPTKKNIAFVSYFKFNTAEKYVPLYSVFKYKLLNDYVKSINIKEYNPSVNHLVDRKWDTLHNPITSEPKKYYFKSDEINAVSKALSDLNKICIQNNCKLMCIQTPVYKVIYEKTDFERTQLICQKLKIPFIDLSHENFKNDINLFYSPTHLNKYGVSKMNLFLKNNAQLNAFFKN